ncbi:hypothetical protein D3C75_977500 [compost metagenome]
MADDDPERLIIAGRIHLVAVHFGRKGDYPQLYLIRICITVAGQLPFYHLGKLRQLGADENAGVLQIIRVQHPAVHFLHNRIADMPLQNLILRGIGVGQNTQPDGFLGNDRIHHRSLCPVMLPCNQQKDKCQCQING